MGKIRVKDLAKKMGIPEQDLLFKFKSIGVRVEGDDAQIDTDIIQAILQGKKLPQPQREVILRDKQSPPAQQKRRPPTRRPPAAPLRPPPRRRTVVNKGEKIRTLPTVAATEKPAEVEPETPAPETPTVAAEVAAATDVVETSVPESTPPPAAAAPPPTTPVQAPARERTAPRVEARDAKGSRRSKAQRVAEIEEQEDLHDFRGDVSALEDAEEETTETTTTRRRRRAERKKQQQEARDEGKIVSDHSPQTVGPVTISEGMNVRDLAEKLGIKSKDLMARLIQRGVMASVNHVLDPELATELAEELGFEAMVVTFEEEVQLQQEVARPSTGTMVRPPVVTIMGHVDHGKTSLLDAIRSSKVVDTEHGGITQHIGAYRVEAGDRQVVVLDTPGHEAFTQLRARGAKVTDIVVLVVAADDGVMPQTKEAIDHARAAKVPIVVAINKMDRPDANPDRVKSGLSDHGLLVEDWGGDTVAVPVSAVKRQGIDELLEMILLTSDLLELKADPELPAQGVVIEARKETGRGTVATVLVQNGTLRVGESFVSGSTWGRVRLMVDDHGERLEEAGPSTPVEVSGFSDIPGAGDTFQVVEEESRAREIAVLRQEEQRQRDLRPSAGGLSLEGLFDRIEKGEVKELPVVLKADVQGSVEVLRDTIEKTGTDQVKVRVLLAGIGAISTNDVLLASASRALIYGFNVRPERNATDLAAKEGVEIRLHTVIYELVEELRKAMAGLLEPEFREVEQGRAEVREIFKVPKIGMVAGCHVIEGVIARSSQIRLLRDNVVIHEGRVGSLRRFKDDAAEVRSGFDCGIGLERFQDVKPGDVIEAYVQEEVTPSLS